MSALLRPRIIAATFTRIGNTKSIARPVSTMNYSSIKTPERCYADFCLIPVGTGTLSVAKEVAEVQRLLKASGLKYTMHSAGTTVGKSGGSLYLAAGVKVTRLTSTQRAAGTTCSGSSARRTRSCIRRAR